jgi:hypothetical protein
MDRKYYVYVHRRKDNNVVFYIGKGTGYRLNSKSHNKTKKWSVVDCQAGGHIVEILRDNLTNEEAMNIEQKYLENPPEDWVLVNVIKKVNKVVELDFKLLNENFKYDESIPSFLSWKTHSYKHNVGDPAGFVKSVGYWYVGLNNKVYRVHRVIYALFNETFDESLVINHIDGNKLNNNIVNLEAITQKENSHPSKKRK